MRFEIGPGGGFVILVGLVGLSAAVFFLGMISGRDMAQTEQGQTQLATVYPMPAAPAAPAPQAAAPAPQAAAPARPAAVAAAAPRPPSHAAVAAAAAARGVAAPPSAQRPARATLASVPPPRPAAGAAEESSAESSDSEDESDTGAEERRAVSPPPAVGNHRGYNIVIDAAMDRASAYRMSSKLLALGYTSHIVPTQINGQTWYRVQVGPYPTQDDARAAQAQLRAAYTARYVNRTSASRAGGAAASSSSDTNDSGSADSDSDDSGDAAGDASPSN